MTLANVPSFHQSAQVTACESAPPVPRPWFIYVLKEPGDDEPRYVGNTSVPGQRLAAHISGARTGRDQFLKAQWVKSVLNRGMRPELHIIESGFGEGGPEAEIRWIAHYRAAGARLTNLTDGGMGTNGYCPPAEARERMRLAQTGRKHSQETLAKMSRSQTGIKKKPMREEERRRRSIVMTGRKLSPESCAKISKAKLGVPRDPLTSEQRQKQIEVSFQSKKTHCKSGHEYDEQNTYITKRNGQDKRACRICRAAAQRRLKARRRA